MKNTAVLALKFQSVHSPAKLGDICVSDLEVFRDVPGLIQKYYLNEELTGSISGVYFFETKSAREAFWTSAFAKKIPGRYGIIMETLRVEQYETAIVLNESVEV